MIFQRLKEEPRNSCREFSIIFKLALAKRIFLLLLPTFLLPHGYYICTLLFAPFCMESHSMICLTSSRFQVTFLGKPQRNSVVLPLRFFLRHRALLCHGRNRHLEAGLPSTGPHKSECSSSSIGAKTRSRWRRPGCLCHCC